jgi:hypothetical protein
MFRHLKALGKTLVAVFAISAMTATAASATDFLTTTKPTALMTGIGTEHIFQIGNTSFACTTAKFSATGTNNGSEVTVDPTYTGKTNETPHSATKCSASVGEVTDVQENGCHYKLTGNTAGSDNGTDATVWIECPGGTEIQILSSLGVSIGIPQQTSTSGGVTYKNLANHSGGSAIEITATLTGITFTCAPAFSCGLAGIATEGNTLSYKGSVIVTGYEDVDGLPTPITEGVQIPISMS